MDGFVRALEQHRQRLREPARCVPTCRQATRGPQRPARRHGLPHGARDPELLGVREALRRCRTTCSRRRIRGRCPSHLFLVSAWVGDMSRSRGPDELRLGSGVPGHNAAHDRKMWIPADGTPRPTSGPTSPGCCTRTTSVGVLRGTATRCIPAVRTAPRARRTPCRCRTRCPASRPSRATDQLENVQSNANYFKAAADGTLPAVSWVMPTTNSGRAPAGRHRQRSGVGDAGRQRGHARAGLAPHRDLHHVGRLGRVLRPRGPAQGGRQRLRDPRARP